MLQPRPRPLPHRHLHLQPARMTLRAGGEPTSLPRAGTSLDTQPFCTPCSSDCGWLPSASNGAHPALPCSTSCLRSCCASWGGVWVLPCVLLSLIRQQPGLCLTCCGVAQTAVQAAWRTCSSSGGLGGADGHRASCCSPCCRRLLLMLQGGPQTDARDVLGFTCAKCSV